MHIQRTLLALAATAALGVGPAAANALTGEPAAITHLSNTCSRDANGALTVKTTWDGKAPTNLVFANFKVVTEFEGPLGSQKWMVHHPEVPGTARSATHVVPPGTWPDQGKVTKCRVYVSSTYAVRAQDRTATISGNTITGP